MAKRKLKDNLDFILSKLQKSIGDIKVIEHTNGISLGGIHEINLEKSILTIINQTGLEKIKQAELNNSPTENIYTDSNCVEFIKLKSILSIK